MSDGLAESVHGEMAIRRTRPTEFFMWRGKMSGGARVMQAERKRRGIFALASA